MLTETADAVCGACNFIPISHPLFNKRMRQALPLKLNPFPILALMRIFIAIVTSAFSIDIQNCSHEQKQL